MSCVCLVMLNIIVVVSLFSVTDGAEIFEIFRDDFNGNGPLNLSVWTPTNHRSEVNSELEYYLPKNVFVKDGFLTLQAEQEKYADANYTSGRLDTSGHFDFLYGEVEWRAKIPKGQGIWPALWMMEHSCGAAVPCDKWPPAVSVIDVRGDKPREIVTTVFSRPPNSTSVSQASNSTIFPMDMSLDFHLYKLSWFVDRLIWYVDNKEIFRVGKEHVPTVKLQVIMDVAIGGNFPGNPDNTTIFPVEMLIDYVVVRQGDIFLLPELKAKDTSRLLPALLGSLLTLSMLILACVIGVAVFFIKRKRRLQGNMRRRSNSYILGLCDSKKEEHIDMPFDPVLQKCVGLLEVPLVSIEISDVVLGKGEYGLVRLGKIVRSLDGRHGPCVVAVKSLIDPSNPIHYKQFVEEMKLMAQIGRHLNIVNVVGVSFKSMALILLEYCPNGSLLSYLRSHRENHIYNHVDPIGQLLPIDQKEIDRLSYEGKKLHLATSEPFDGKILSTQDFLGFACQICCGMKYLVLHSVIHRDLAARNVLVADNGIVKIADFGMARLRETDYVQNTNAAMPVKWMAPETLKLKIFSQASDVWSYGVLLWELFSVGERPYAGYDLTTYGENLLTGVSSGLRLQRPVGCPNEMYSLMQKCWSYEPNDRPTFSALKIDTQNLAGATASDYYLRLNEPYEIFNNEHQELVQT